MSLEVVAIPPSRFSVLKCHYISLLDALIFIVLTNAQDVIKVLQKYNPSLFSHRLPVDQ